MLFSVIQDSGLFKVQFRQVSL